MYSPANDLKIERNIGRFADINQYNGLRLKTSFGRSTQLIKPLPLTNILWEERFDFSFTSKRFFRVSRFYTVNMTTLPVSGPL